MTDEYLSPMNIPHERFHPTAPTGGWPYRVYELNNRERTHQAVWIQFLAEAKNIVDRYMMFYNKERIHSAIG